MEPKEKKEIRLILMVQQINDNMIYSVDFSAHHINLLCWTHNFMSSSSHHKTAVLGEIEIAATSLPNYTFIIVIRKDNPKEEIDFINEVYDMLINHGNDVLFEVN